MDAGLQRAAYDGLVAQEQVTLARGVAQEWIHGSLPPAHAPG